ncbi:MAG: restriction endonuclease subunit S [Candidatus Nanoarchaeia archaeon]|nr:restriction endonuclease subunit S [Candidatus Nanoarchaeia archaeon]
MIRIKDVIVKIEGPQTKIDKKLWLNCGDLPVISQESTQNINNYVNKKDFLSIKDLPLIVFGDHTCIFKYIDFNFVRGADGTQLIKPNKNYDIKFFYYLLQYIRKFIPELKKYQRHFKYLKEMDISRYNFNYKYQKKIALVLSVLDSKIEFNNKINSELEKMVKNIYNYWFVQFDFPDENGKPYKANKGKMVWSEDLKKDIPCGWGVKKLTNLLEKNTDKFVLNGSKHDIDTIDLSVMPNSTMCLTEKNTSDEFGTNLFKMNKFDILFGGIRPYLLKAGFAPFNGLVTGTVLSYRVIKNFDYNFVLLTMVHDSVFKFAVSNSRGTKMPVIASDDLLSYKFAYNENIVKKFNEIISFKEIISKNVQENQKLVELRDWLLPMLMNGQVKVN